MIARLVSSPRPARVAITSPTGSLAAPTARLDTSAIPRKSASNGSPMEVRTLTVWPGQETLQDGAGPPGSLPPLPPADPAG